jgi:putative DNA primase/helicase
MMSASRKFLNKVSFINHAKMIFCTNELPWVYDNSFAFYERWVMLNFPYTFLPKHEIEKMKDVRNVKEADNEIIDKITTDEELSGLLNWSLEGLKRLLERGEFSSSSTAEEIQIVWQRNSNNVIAFIKDCFDEVYGERITKQDFRQYYTEYCKFLKLRPMGDKHIKNTLETEFGLFDSQNIQSDGQQSYCWNGIKFNKNKFDSVTKMLVNTLKK